MPRAAKKSPTEVQRGGSPRSTSPVKVSVAERQRRALELRARGHTYTEIAKELGYATKGGAQRLVVSALTAQRSEAAEPVLELELARLDSLQRALSPRALRGDVNAVQATLRVMERRAKYLGLDHNESRTADAVEAIATAYAAQADWIQRALGAVLDRLDLTPEQQSAAPLIIAGVLEEHANNQDV